MGCRRVLSGIFRHIPEPVEQQGNAPKTCYADDGVDNPAQQHIGAAEEPCRQIKLEKTHQAPVDTADNGKHKCENIHKETSCKMNCCRYCCRKL